jgi:hypothetical protein
MAKGLDPIEASNGESRGASARPLIQPCTAQRQQLNGDYGLGVTVSVGQNSNARGGGQTLSKSQRSYGKFEKGADSKTCVSRISNFVENILH